MSISYAPGTAFALVRPGVVVLLDGSVAPASVSAVWSSLERLGRLATSMADVLDAVTTVLDPSLRELPDFAIVLHEVTATGDETGVLHVVARGKVSVHLAGEVGSETIEAFDMTTWADKRFTDVDHYEVAAGPTGIAADLSLALSSGVVTARSVSWQRPQETEVEPESAVGDAGAEAVSADGGEASDAEHHEPPAAVTVVPVVEPDPAMIPVHAAEPDFARTLGEFPDGALDDEDLDEDGGDGLDEAVRHDDAFDDATRGDGGVDDAPHGDAPHDEPLAGEPQAERVADQAAEDEPSAVEGPADADPSDENGADENPADENPADENGADEDRADEERAEEGSTDERPADDLEPPAADHHHHAASTPGDLDDVEEDTVLSVDGLRATVQGREQSPGAIGQTAAPVVPAASSAAPVTSSVPSPALAALPPVPPPPPAPVAPAPDVSAAPGASSYPVYQAAPQTPPGEALAAAPLPQGAPSPASGPVPTSAPLPTVAPAPGAPAGHGAPPSGQQWSVQLPGTPPTPVDVVSPPPVPASDVPTILARSCAYGHANTPVRSTCAVCGGGLNPQAEVVPRPSLGRVLLSTGDVVELEQPVVFGRYPQAHVVTAQAQAPLLVTVPSPSQDISRSHLEVRLEGWNVLLVDLTTVNGTTLLRPGQPPRRLHPQEPTLVVSGDVADLGDGVRLTFEGVA